MALKFDLGIAVASARTDPWPSTRGSRFKRQLSTLVRQFENYNIYYNIINIVERRYYY